MPIWSIRATLSHRHGARKRRVGEAALAHYRMFLLDGRGRILAREEYEASDDADAVAKARALFAEREREHYSAYEVWQLNRVVHREERK